MAEISPEEAINHAQSEVGLDATLSARAERIRRLDREGEDYYLVIFGDDNATNAVVVVDVKSGEIKTSAQLPGSRSHLSIDSARAVELAGLGEGAQAQLVWRPSPASRSPLYPFWEVRGSEKIVYVDQQGMAWGDLSESGRGG